MSKRIVHVITRFINGGADENTLASCNWNAENGDDVYLIYGNHVAPEIIEKLHPRVTHIQVPNIQRDISPHKDYAAYKDLVSIFRRIKPDLVHTHTSKAGIIGRAAAAKLKITAVHGVHIAPFLNVNPISKLVYSAAERVASRWTAAYIHVSEAMQAACEEAGIGRGRPHFMIRSGMNVTDFAEAHPPEDWEPIVGVAPGTPKPPIIVMIAALEERKRQIPFIENLHYVWKQCPDARLLLLGDGINRPAVEEAISKTAHPDQIRLLGFRKDPARILALADVAALCSTREGLPRVAIQYVASGTPSVIAALPGIEEIIRDGVEGIITSPTDVSETAIATGKLLSDADMRARMSAACRAKDISNWSINTMCERQEQVYKQVLN
ncbi:glycosyltransferase [Altererythrobacter indicus]|uniref:Glycosyltransferase n=1 Tax=Altericroceibacterium indicum TaxID=374177 RepID=A0A845ACQ6_9SPHN|nr:glycosyltransferase [Altericroceibacterium indicum]MXP27023.1 glycosyltransferase [Altericroceibacterium indicum]